MCKFFLKREMYCFMVTMLKRTSETMKCITQYAILLFIAHLCYHACIKLSMSVCAAVDETTTDIICIKCKRDDSDTPNEIVLCDRCGIGEWKVFFGHSDTHMHTHAAV